MNVFQSTSASFRRGGGLTDTSASTSTAATATSASAIAAATTASATHLQHGADPGGRVEKASAVPDLSSSGTAPGLPRTQLVDLPALLTAAQPARPPQPATPRRPFPSMPYYGLLSSCEVHVDIAAEEEHSAARTQAQAPPHRDAAARPPPLPSLQAPRSLPMSAARLADVQRQLSTVAARHGTVYCLGTGSTLADNLMMAQRASGAATQVSAASSAVPAAVAVAAHSGLTLGAYADALQSVFCEMAALRHARLPVLDAAACGATAAAAAATATHHTAYVRLAGHPAWREVSAMLCVEHGRLLLCLVASSRVTQKRLGAACAVMGVPLEWFGGAALVAEPQHLQTGDANPVWVAWEALSHLPMLPISAALPSDEGASIKGEAATADGERDASAAVREVLCAVRDAATVLAGFHVSVIASLPFRGAAPCAQVGRITEESTVMTQPGSPSSPPRVVGRRFVWRLLPPQPSLGLGPGTGHSRASLASTSLRAAPCAVLPFLVTKLLEGLVEGCELNAFRIRCGAAGMDGAATATAAGPASVAQAATGAVGVRLVHSSAPWLLTLRRGPSSTSWTGFSRLSSSGADGWVDAETREGLRAGGLQGRTTGSASAAATAAVELGGGASGVDAPADTDEDMDDTEAEEDEVETEFELTSIDYERLIVPDATAADVQATKRARTERDTATDAEGLSTAVDPARWGRGFRFGLTVKRVIAVDAGDT